jgi:hypothetical protein
MKRTYKAVLEINTGRVETVAQENCLKMKHVP